MENKKEVMILYQCVIDKLKKESDQNGEILRNKVLFIFGTSFHIPKELKNVLLAELIELEMVEVSRKFRKKIYYKVA